ncbi:MAG: TIGR03936 family radical SAM-associated protein [Clostridia bacterium]|nr:TIGR03936 family radical SAM-associated protein [Clostridia bacterium]
MIKYRFGYAKYGEAKYVSHLDLIRLFSRSFKRAHIPLTYSEGFNPHPKLAIGLPLSVGVTSECECMDVEVDRELKKEDIDALNRSLPIGIHINGLCEKIPGTKKLSDIRFAEYRVTVVCDPVDPEKFSEFMSRPSVVVEKKTKRKTEECDILPDIHALSVCGITDDGLMLTMTLSAGPSANLKPDLVLTAMEKYIEGFNPKDYDIHRAKILSDAGLPLL